MRWSSFGTVLCSADAWRNKQICRVTRTHNKCGLYITRQTTRRHMLRALRRIEGRLDRIRVSTEMTHTTESSEEGNDFMEESEYETEDSYDSTEEKHRSIDYITQSMSYLVESGGPLTPAGTNEQEGHVLYTYNGFLITVYRPDGGIYVCEITDAEDAQDVDQFEEVNIETLITRLENFIGTHPIPQNPPP